MKFVIFSDYGGFVPDVLIPVLKKNQFPMNRYCDETLNYIKDHLVIYSDENELRNKENPADFSDYFKKNPDVIVKLENDKDATRYYAYSSTKQYVTSFHIVDIDPTKHQYTVDAYDGAEGIHPVPTYKCIDQNANIWVPADND
jgi:hypothetical protein